MEDVIQANHINLWIHGHAHYCVDYTIGNCRIIGNQRGYATEHVAGFQPNKTLPSEPLF